MNIRSKKRTSKLEIPTIDAGESGSRNCAGADYGGCLVVA